MNPVGIGSDQFHQRWYQRDWLLWFDDVTIAAENWIAIFGAICIAIIVFGLPIYLIVADHVSLLKILSGP